MIANDIAETETKNNAITETKTKNREDQERRWQWYQLVYGTKELRNMDTLAQSGIRGSEVTMCLIVRSEVDWYPWQRSEVNGCESESSDAISGMPEMCDSSGAE